MRRTHLYESDCLLRSLTTVECDDPACQSLRIVAYFCWCLFRSEWNTNTVVTPIHGIDFSEVLVLMLLFQLLHLFTVRYCIYVYFFFFHVLPPVLIRVTEKNWHCTRCCFHAWLEAFGSCRRHQSASCQWFGSFKSIYEVMSHSLHHLLSQARGMYTDDCEWVSVPTIWFAMICWTYQKSVISEIHSRIVVYTVYKESLGILCWLDNIN